MTDGNEPACRRAEGGQAVPLGGEAAVTAVASVPEAMRELYKVTRLAVSDAHKRAHEMTAPIDRAFDELAGTIIEMFGGAEYVGDCATCGEIIFSTDPDRRRLLIGDEEGFVEDEEHYCAGCAPDGAERLDDQAPQPPDSRQGEADPAPSASESKP